MIEDPIARLRLRFIERAHGQLAALKTLAGDQIAVPSEKHADLVRIAHSLSGAGGTFGFPEVSRCAFELETALTAPGGTDQVAIQQHLARLIAELESALA
ncbi:Hpt domain-containing protein [Labrys neptuniae]|uniref:Hpt domain-containing protein n=1 Tax=Labrys neptuniae TaxID=376174 RepID=UPI0035D8411B